LVGHRSTIPLSVVVMNPQWRIAVLRELGFFYS